MRFFNNHSYYVYIVSCADGTFYTGITNNPPRRIRQHNGLNWGGGKYTRSRRPVFLMHLEKYDTKSQALQREYTIKALSRGQKEELIKSTSKDSILSAMIRRRPQIVHNTYFALRHGRSIANEQRMIVSAPDHALSGYGLSVEGRVQVQTSVAQARDDRLLDSNVVIFSSDFLRTKETAEIAAEILGIGGINRIIFTPKLRERFFGAWEKTPTSNYDKIWSDDEADHTHKRGGIESVSEVQKRVFSLIDEIEAAYKDRSILLVSHGDVLQILQTAFENLHPSRHRSLTSLHTGELRRLSSRNTNPASF